MLNKKIFALAIFLVVSLLAISAVSAADDVVSVDSENDDVVSVDDLKNDDVNKDSNHDILLSSESQDVISQDNGGLDTSPLAVESASNSPILSSSHSKIIKSPTKVKCKSFTTKIGAKESVSVKILDSSGSSKNIGGKAKFKINGKTYSAKVKKGVATVKNVYLPSKAKTIKCYVKYLGDYKHKASTGTFKIKLSKNKVVTLNKKHRIKMGKYVLKLSSKQYKSLINAFKKGKSKSILIKTNYKYKVRLLTYQTAYKYKTTKACKTWYATSYIPMINKMRYSGWKKVSEYTYTKKNPYNKYGIGLSAYTFAVCKWAKSYQKPVYKTFSYPIKAKIVLKSYYKQPIISLFSNYGNTLGNRYLAIA